MLLVPAGIGISRTKVNYDILSYLPEDLETVKGQEIMVDQFGTGAFSMVVVEDMPLKNVAALKEKIEGIDHVEKVLWYDSVADLSIPVDMLPKKIRDVLFQGNATMMAVMFDDTTSSDTSMEAVSQMRDLVGKECFISGMTGIVTDIKNLSLKEMPMYVVIAAVLCLIVLGLTMESFVVPVLFLISIGAAILYNLGSNLFLGDFVYYTSADSGTSAW